MAGIIGSKRVFILKIKFLGTKKWYRCYILPRQNKENTDKMHVLLI
jgi:hypothetical protein